jgi:hypothetical protein
MISKRAVVVKKRGLSYVGVNEGEEGDQPGEAAKPGLVAFMLGELYAC